MGPPRRACYLRGVRIGWSWAWGVLALAACAQAPVRQSPAPLPGAGWVSLAHYGTHPVVDTEEQAVVRVGLSADRAAWGLTYHYIERDRLPPPEAVRVEDCVAALAPAPKGAGDAGSIAATLAPSPFRAGWHTLLIAITAPRRAGTRHLLVVSEAPDGALERALAERGARVVPGDVRALAAHLDGGDVVLVGDGAGLGGPDAQPELLARVAAHRARGGTLSVVARLGPGLDDALLDRLALEGGGTHDADVPGEEDRLAERLTRPMGLARAVAQVRFDARRVARWRLVGHESRVAGPAAPPVGGLVPSGEAVYLLFEVKLAQIGEEPLGAFRVDALGVALDATLEGAPPSETHHAVVAIAAFAEKLRGSFWARDIAWQAIEDAVAALASPTLRTELGGIVRRTRSLWDEPAGLERPIGATRWLP